MSPFPPLHIHCMHGMHAICIDDFFMVTEQSNNLVCVMPRGRRAEEAYYVQVIDIIYGSRLLALLSFT